MSIHKALKCRKRQIVRQRAGFQSGFTTLELIVVLVISGFASSM